MLSWAEPGRGEEPCSAFHESPSPAANFRFWDTQHLIITTLAGSSLGQSPWLTQVRQHHQLSPVRKNLLLLISSAMK